MREGGQRGEKRSALTQVITNKRVGVKNHFNTAVSECVSSTTNSSAHTRTHSYMLMDTKIQIKYSASLPPKFSRDKPFLKIKYSFVFLGPQNE